jgi:hypothetical protein
MASEVITLHIHPRGRRGHVPNTPSVQKTHWSIGKPIRKLLGDIKISSNALAHELYDALAGLSGYSVHRLRITKGSNGGLIPNGNETLYEAGLRNESVIHVKDLGINNPPFT